MSLQFNDTSTYKGLVQMYEKETGRERGEISDNDDNLKEFAADVNVAFDDFLSLALPASGTWQLDDSNHIKYSTITTNLNASQRDYTFTEDEQGNLILDIYKVMIADESGVFRAIDPVDMQSENNTSTFFDGNNSTGAPSRYDKTANGILLDLIPSYSYTKGLKVFINREGSYFVYNDTTKMPGVDGRLHKWFYIKPSAEYARINSLDNSADLQREVAKLELLIGEIYGKRQRDVRPRMTPGYQNNK